MAYRACANPKEPEFLKCGRAWACLNLKTTFVQIAANVSCEPRVTNAAQRANGRFDPVDNQPSLTKEKISWQVFVMELISTIVIFLGGLAGGFVTGLAGFGTGLTALVFWLFVLSPTTASTLVVVCSVAAQSLTLHKIWHSIELPRVLPFVLPGLIGVPLGVQLLTQIDIDLFKLCVGGILIVYTAQGLLLKSGPTINWGGRVADGVVGFGGGVLGGLAGLSGPLPTMWANMRDWTKEQKRSVIQVFNLTILLVALITHALGGLITGSLLNAALIALPGAGLGAWIGYLAYAQISDVQFAKIILVLLGLSGLFLTASSL